MFPSLPFLMRSFSEWNAKAFSPQLPAVKLRVTNARSYEGLFRVKVIHRRGIPHYFPDITISAFYDKSSQEIVDILLHEMIHFYIWHNKIKDSSKHGTVFRRMMQEINHKHNRHLSISHRRTIESSEKAIVNTVLPLIVAQPHNNSPRLICVPSQSRLEHIYHYLRKLNTMTLSVFVSTDKRLTMYPRIRTPKLYNIESDILDQIIEKAHLVKP